MNTANPKSFYREKTKAMILEMGGGELATFMQDLDLAAFIKDLDLGIRTTNDIFWLSGFLRKLADGYSEHAGLLEAEGG